LDLDPAPQPDPVDDPPKDRRLGLLHLVARDIRIEGADHLPDRHITSPNGDLEPASVRQG
jgi:hypothetical protein